MMPIKKVCYSPQTRKNTLLGGGAKVMVYRGHILNGVVVFDVDVQLPEGAVVTVQVATPPETVGDEDPVYRLGELAVSTGISDLAQNIDHYLYGQPKVNDAQ